MPYLVPEVQLFYKANARRPGDEADFTAVLLSAALGLVYGEEHPWRARL